MSTSNEVRRSYRWCRQLAVRHYENFPVASRLLPARLRDPVAALYAFARSADDIADEGDRPAPQRLRELDAMGEALESIGAGGAPDQRFYPALADTLRRFDLPLPLLHDLLDAFRQDVEKNRYADFGELMDYCRRSANPVGRLLLHLTGNVSERNLARSDAVCSALQLINFLQDIEQDYREHGRIYLPQNDMHRFGVDEADIAVRRNTPQTAQLMRFQVQRAAQLLRAGSPLGTTLRGRFGLELRAVVLGAARVLEKLHKQSDIFGRPRLNRRDRVAIVWGALRQGFK
jgi:squalene synthase HpnC